MHLKEITSGFLMIRGPAAFALGKAKNTGAICATAGQVPTTWQAKSMTSTAGAGGPHGGPQSSAIREEHDRFSGLCTYIWVLAGNG